jgi:hypothetical protein
MMGSRRPYRLNWITEKPGNQTAVFGIEILLLRMAA